MSALNYDIFYEVEKYLPLDRLIPFKIAVGTVDRKLVQTVKKNLSEFFLILVDKPQYLDELGLSLTDLVRGVFTNHTTDSSNPVMKHSVWEEKQIYDALLAFIEENPSYKKHLPKSVFTKTFFKEDKWIWDEIEED